MLVVVGLFKGFQSHCLGHAVILECKVRICD